MEQDVEFPFHMTMVMQELAMLDKGYTHTEIERMTMPEFMLRSTMIGEMNRLQARDHKREMEAARRGR